MECRSLFINKTITLLFIMDGTLHICEGQG